jgi:hypothetical protein
VIYFPPPKSRPEHNGLWLKLKAKIGKTWIGVFKLDEYRSPSAFSRVLSSPDTERVCVVSNGSAYIVNSEKPDMWEQLPIYPVLDVRPLVEQKLRVFADFNRLAAYGSGGLVWRSPRVCWDFLKITNVTSDVIEGTAYDPANAETHESRFAVDLTTGNSLLPLPASMPE